MDDRTRVQGAAKKSAPKRKRKRKVSGWAVFRRVMLNMVKFVFVLGCVGLVIGSFIAVQVVEYVVTATANDDSILDIENISLKQTSYIMAQNPDTGEWFEYQELIGDENRIWVSYSEIPENLVNAVVAIEDREFFEHKGVSFRRTAYALLNEVLDLEDSTFGASTIHQQLVKNLTGDDAVGQGDDRSAGYLRKLREIFRAWGLNNNYSKQMIMEAYLNTMSLSGNIAGVQAGAIEYFDKDVSELTLDECALIAGITRAPTKYSPYLNPENCLNRRNSVLWQMYLCEFITLAEYEEYSEKPLGLQERTSSGSQSSIFSYYSDQVFNDVFDALRAEKFGPEYTDREVINYIYTGGLRIYCAVDIRAQEAVEKMYLHGYEDTEEAFFTNLTSNGRSYKDLMTYTVTHNGAGEELEEPYEVLPQSAVAILRYDGSLAAVAGGVGEKEYSLAHNRATDSVRQVGSTMKPVAAYALGLDYGLITWSSMVLDAPALAIGSSGSSVAGGNKNWPSNFSKTYRNTTMPIVSAIAESTNTVAVRVGMNVTLEQMFDYLTETLEISSLIPAYDPITNEVNAMNDVGESALILGGMTNGISPYELAGAYQVFGGENTYGVHNSLHSFYQILDSKGSLVLKPQVASKQAVSADTGFVMNRLLWNVMNGSGLPLGVTPTGRGTAPEGEMEAVGKTGTTNDDNDRWLVGLTPYYVTAVWWGYDEQYKGYDYRGYNGTADLYYWARLNENVPNKVFKALMEEIQEDLEYKEFPEQPDTVTQHAFCSITGDLKGDSCPSGGVGYYSAAHMPDTCSGFHGNLEEAAEEG